jgi:hypothetical protein
VIEALKLVDFKNDATNYLQIGGFYNFNFFAKILVRIIIIFSIIENIFKENKFVIMLNSCEDFFFAVYY